MVAEQCFHVLRFVTRPLFRQIRSDQFASKLFIITVYGSILANLNKAMRTKQHAMKKTALILKKTQDLQKSLLVVEGF